MEPNWTTIGLIAAPVIAAVVGALFHKLITDRPRLVAYLGHIASFVVRGQPEVPIYLHSLVIRNMGPKSATNVRLAHGYLPKDFVIHPDVEYHVADLPAGGKEILIPRLVPK